MIIENGLKEKEGNTRVKKIFITFKTGTYKHKATCEHSNLYV